MADYRTRFSSELDVGTAENARQALAIYDKLATDIATVGTPEIGFTVSTRGDERPSVLWIRDSDGAGVPDHVVTFVARCAEVFDLAGPWGFSWAYLCSSQRVDAFGGGAHAMSLEDCGDAAWVDTRDWLAEEVGRVDTGEAASFAPSVQVSTPPRQ